MSLIVTIKCPKNSRFPVDHISLISIELSQNLLGHDFSYLFHIVIITSGICRISIHACMHTELTFTYTHEDKLKQLILLLKFTSI